MVVSSGRTNGEGLAGSLRPVTGVHSQSPLPVAVKAEAARASYNNGVLRVELPKANPGRQRGVTLKVE